MNDKDTVARPVKQLTFLIDVTRGRWRRVLRGDFKTGVMWRRVGWVWHWLGVPYRELGGLATGVCLASLSGGERTEMRFCG